jgi:hypothetical protein
MAWYLISKKSRFRYSHDFQFLPVKDFEDIVEGTPIKTYLACQNKKNMVPTNAAVEHMHHPESLEDECSFACTEKFRVVNMTSKESHNSQLLRFLEGDDPNSQQGLIHRHHGLEVLQEKVIPVLSHGHMTDGAKLDVNLLDPLQTRRHKLKYLHELHASRILHLFLPFHVEEDLKTNGSYVEKLQWAVANNKLHSNALDILQNIQDCRNSLDSMTRKDRLTRCTVKPAVDGNDKSEEPNDDEVDTVTELLAMLDQQDEPPVVTDASGGRVPMFDMHEVRSRGKKTLAAVPSKTSV